MRVYPVIGGGKCVEIGGGGDLGRGTGVAYLFGRLEVTERGLEIHIENSDGKSAQWPLGMPIVIPFETIEKAKSSRIP